MVADLMPCYVYGGRPGAMPCVRIDMSFTNLVPIAIFP